MRISALSFLVIAVLPGTVSAQAGLDAERGVQLLLEKFAQEFRAAGSPAALAALFLPDGEVKNITDGWTRRGTEELERLWAAGFERHRGFSLDVRIHSVRILAPGVALVDGSLEREAGRLPDGQPVPAWREHFTMLVLERDGRWSIAAARAGGWTPVDPGLPTRPPASDPSSP